MLTMIVQSAKSSNDNYRHHTNITSYSLYKCGASVLYRSSNCDNTIYTIKIITLRHFLFNLIKSSECRHNKIMFRVRCPQIFQNEFGFIDSLSFILFFSDRSLKSTQFLSALSIFSLFLSPSCFLSPNPSQY